MKKEIRNSYKCILTLTKELFPEKIPLICENMKGNSRKTNSALSNAVSKIKGLNVTLAINIFSDSQNKDVANLFLLTTMKIFELDLPNEELIYEDIENSITLKNSIPYLAYYTYVENIEYCNKMMLLIEEMKKNSPIELFNDKNLKFIEKLKSDNEKLTIKNKDISTKLKEIKLELNNYKKKLDKYDEMVIFYEEKCKSIEKELLLTEESSKQKDEIIKIEIDKNEKLTEKIKNFTLKKNDDFTKRKTLETSLNQHEKILLLGKKRGLSESINNHFIEIENTDYKIHKVVKYLDAEKIVYVVLTEIPADLKFEILKLNIDSNKLKIFKDKQELLHYIKRGE